MFIELYLNSHLRSFSEAIFILRVHDGSRVVAAAVHAG